MPEREYVVFPHWMRSASERARIIERDRDIYCLKNDSPVFSQIAYGGQTKQLSGENKSNREMLVQ